LVIKGATLSTKYAAKLAESFSLSKYTIGFIVVAIISILPETFISISSAIAGMPAFGLATLFGSNIADLTLVFFLIIIFSGRKIKIESKILKHNRLFPLLLVVPIILGLNGHFSRLEGLALIVTGVAFYFLAIKNGADISTYTGNKIESRLKNFFWLLLGMVLLLTGSHFVVSSASSLATAARISPILIGMLIVGLGTTIPELFFSLKSVRKKDDGLAIGDIFGTVLADATIVVGILALISPFSFPAKIVYITGLFMVGASVFLLQLMKSDRTITKKEAFLLLAYWVFFVIVEYLLNRTN
jgi:cation:H+ antiporter